MINTLLSISIEQEATERTEKSKQRQLCFLCSLLFK